MKRIILFLLLLAALIFIGVSAAMNALFLSSLGRTALEAGLLVTISVTADVIKAILPLVAGLAFARQAWAQGISAALLLIVVVGLSLTSGTGFAALTRGAMTAARESDAARLAQMRSDLDEVESQLRALVAARPLAVVEAEQARLAVDRRWSATRSCSEVAAARAYCADVARLAVEQTVARERDGLTARRRELRASIETHAASPRSPDSDPQVAALAGALGVERDRLRMVLTIGLAALLELGSVVLVALAFGSLPAHRRETPAPSADRGRNPEAVKGRETLAGSAISVPEAKDRAWWRKNQFQLRTMSEGDGDVRSGR